MINVRSYCTDELKTAMTDYKVKYTTAQKYSAIGNMHTISTVGASLPDEDPTKVLTGDELVALYNRGNPNDVDESNNLQYPVLRQAGVVALDNLIKPQYIDFIMNFVCSCFRSADLRCYCAVM